jgi:hypothetical protein
MLTYYLERILCWHTTWREFYVDILPGENFMLTYYLERILCWCWHTTWREFYVEHIERKIIKIGWTINIVYLLTENTIFSVMRFDIKTWYFGWTFLRVLYQLNYWCQRTRLKCKDDHRQTQYLTWLFGSGELKCNNIQFCIISYNTIAVNCR